MSSLIVAGSTGAIGREVIVESVREPSVARVVALSRRAIPAEEWKKVFGDSLDESAAAKKLQVVAVDWEKLSTSRAAYMAVNEGLLTAFSGHDFAAMCMGTTRKDAGSAEAFRRCDYDYVTAFTAAVCEASGSSLKHLAQVSSQGANASSWFLYMKTKGEADVAVEALLKSLKRDDVKLSLLRPGLLGRGEKSRGVESFFSCFVSAMPVRTVAMAMLHQFVSPVEGPCHVLDNRGISSAAESRMKAKLCC